MFISQLGSDDMESNVVRITEAKGKTSNLFALIMCNGAMECALVFMLLLHSTSPMFLSVAQVPSFWLVALLHLQSVCVLQ